MESLPATCGPDRGGLAMRVFAAIGIDTSNGGADGIDSSNGRAAAIETSNGGADGIETSNGRAADGTAAPVTVETSGSPVQIFFNRKEENL